MSVRLTTFLKDFWRLFFPKSCCVCGTPLVGDEEGVCTRCLLSIPLAESTLQDGNFLETRFQGRVSIEAASALLHFRKDTPSQNILHSIKYYNNYPLAKIMGRQMGHMIKDSGRFDSVDLLIPVPLHRRKERQRGYNQSLLLCQGITEVWPRPISTGNLIRTTNTKSQTHKTREERLVNMEDVFEVLHPEELENKHILLIDDVITTGATTEGCCLALLSEAHLRISIAALAVAGDQ
ncbi:MAG: ComF family protein [Bacteroidales bacterium]|nr:ComF family protein [Bacteroidales bacterium]